MYIDTLGIRLGTLGAHRSTNPPIERVPAGMANSPPLANVSMFRMSLPDDLQPPPVLSVQFQLKSVGRWSTRSSSIDSEAFK